jgi:hypothetical protein
LVVDGSTFAGAFGAAPTPPAEAVAETPDWHRTNRGEP